MARRLTKEEKMAVVRVLTDNIKVDKVIDSREMETYSALREEFGVTREIEEGACGMTLGDAVMVLRNSASEDKELATRVLEATGTLNDSDGFRPREEALFSLALLLSLAEPENPELDAPDILSYEIDSNWFEPDQILFVESSHDIKTNAAVRESLRTITTELRLCAFDFIYIPSICQHYVESPRELLYSIVSMVAPYLDPSQVDDLIMKIKLYKTTDFTVEQLGYKLGMAEMTDTYPALLLRINNSRVGGKFIANFLRIPIGENVEDRVRSLCDSFLSFHSSDRAVISLKKDTRGRFLFSGFYRQLLEILLLRRRIVSTVAIDPIRNRIHFPEPNKTLMLGRRERALLTLFVYEQRNGGVSFQCEGGASALKKFNLRMERLQKKYQVIYEMFGGDPENTPLITDPSTRSPMLTKIRKAVSEVSEDVHEADRLAVRKDRNGLFSITAPLDRFRIVELRNQVPGEPAVQVAVPVHESELFRRLREIDEHK